MAEREIRKCSKCGHYSFQLGRCLLGKINPPTIKGGVDAVSFMGFSYICGYAKHYDKIRAELIKRIQKSAEVDVQEYGLKDKIEGDE